MSSQLRTVIHCSSLFSSLLLPSCHAGQHYECWKAHVSNHLGQGCGGGTPLLILMLDYHYCSHLLGVFSDKEKKKTSPYLQTVTMETCFALNLVDINLLQGEKNDSFWFCFANFHQEPWCVPCQPPHASSKDSRNTRAGIKSPSALLSVSSFPVAVAQTHTHKCKTPTHSDTQFDQTLGSRVSRNGQTHKVTLCQDKGGEGQKVSDGWLKFFFSTRWTHPPA